MRPASLARVQRLVADLEQAPVRGQVLAVVVCGSAARGEDVDAGEGGTSDIDLMVVTRTRSPLVGRRIQTVLAPHAEHGLEGGQTPVRTLAAHRTLLNYEARCNGSVVMGSAAVLDAVPMQGPEDIPRWEAVRLLGNRTMEHVRHRAGEIGDRAVITKSYEAIGEAELVLARRYRPSFAERWAEVEAEPLPEDVVADLTHKYQAVAALRRGESSDLPATSETALGDLLRTLARAIGACTGTKGDAEEQLERIGRLERHSLQRLYWLLASGDRPELNTLRVDPSVALYQRAVRHLRHAEDASAAKSLIAAWRRCPQIRTPRACV